MIPAKGIATHGPKEALRPFSFERRNPRDHDVVIDIQYCGICHSDIHQARDEWGGSQFPMVPGHEIAGVVRAVGAQVTRHQVGDPVGIGCFVDSCRTCENCKQSLDQYCLEGNTVTYNGYERDGTTPTYGGYSNTIVVDENYVLKIPETIPLDQAAPLLCAGITLFSPLKHWRAGPGKRVGVMGLGGLGHMGVKIGAAMGAEMTVLSHSDAKRVDAFRMGAHQFVSSSNPDHLKKYKNYFDLIINTVSAEIPLNDYLELLKLDGSMVAVGVPEKSFSIHPFPLIMLRRSYSGSLIGSIAETQEMLHFCAKHQALPEVEVISPHQVNQAYERVLKRDVRYRFVMDMTQL